MFILDQAGFHVNYMLLNNEIIWVKSWTKHDPDLYVVKITETRDEIVLI